MKKRSPNEVVRAFATLEIKAVDDEAGIITGIASTPAPDRMDDIVLPQGAVFKLPIPLLWQHKATEPIGKVIEAKVTAAGIEVVAEIARGVSAEIDRAWTLIKAGLVRGLSIGFRGLETESIPNSWGVIFVKWEWLELSAVTIPANAEATITSVKKFDVHAPTASGQRGKGSVPPGDTGKNRLPIVSLKPKSLKEHNMKTTSQKIADFTEAKKQKSLRMTEIMETAGDETLDADEGEEYDTLSSEVKALDTQIARLKDLEAITTGKTKAVAGGETETGASESRSTEFRVKSQPKLDPGIAVARLAKCRAVAFKHHVPAHAAAEQMYGSESDTAKILKAAVVPGLTTSGNWAADLISAEGAAYADFAAFLRPFTILGKFGQGDIPSLRPTPFREPLIKQTGGGQGYWVGEAKPKPLTAFDFDRTTLEPLKVANICVLSDENIRSSSPASDVIVRDALRDALAERLDIDFIDPAKAAAAGVSPASITNGVTPTHSAGTDADAVRADIKAAVGKFITAKNPPSSGVWIMSSMVALTLSLMRNNLGQREFPDITMYGGKLEGFPVITSEYVPSVTAGSYLTLINAQDIYLGDENGVQLDMSTEASLEMKDSGFTQDGAAGTGVAMVSMFQNNLVAFRAERIINWKKRRDSAVAVIDQVAYAVD